MRGIRPDMPFLVTAAAVALFSLMDALMKHAAIAIGAYSALLIRSLIGSAIMLPLWRKGGTGWPPPDAPQRAASWMLPAGDSASGARLSASG